MVNGIKEYSEKLGINVCIEMDPAILVPEERIRKYCEEIGAVVTRGTTPVHRMRGRLVIFGKDLRIIAGGIFFNIQGKWT